MLKSYVPLIVALVFLAVSSWARASSPEEGQAPDLDHAAANSWVGRPVFGGDGCSGMTATSVANLRIQYSVSLVPGQLHDRRSCDIAIPVIPWSGYQLSLSKVSYSLQKSLPSAHVRAGTELEAFYAGAWGESDVRSFTGPNHAIANLKLPPSKVEWTPCGDGTSGYNLRLHTAAEVTGDGTGESDSAFATMLIDVKDVQIRKCK